MTDTCHGVLLVDKPKGPTSHDVVDRIRRHFGLRKVGHGGTLDPQATGLLVILVGRATRISNLIMGSDKVYEGEMTFGITTDSHDADGAVLEQRDPAGLTREAVLEGMRPFQGDRMQIPPMVSAVKKDGVPLYKLARKGREVERAARLIHVYEFRLLEWLPPRATFRLKCTKGTYVRSLCHELGQQLGCGAHLSALRRTRSGALSVDDAVSMPQLLDDALPQFAQRLIPMAEFPPLRNGPNRVPDLSRSHRPHASP